MPDPAKPKKIIGSEGDLAGGAAAGTAVAPATQPRTTPAVREFDGVLRQDNGRWYADAGSLRIRIQGGAAPGSQAPARAGKPVPPELQRALEVAGKYRAELMRYPGVVRVRAGYQFQNGQIQQRAAVVVAVRRKLPAGQLQAAQVLPREIEGVPVDVAPASPRELLAEAGRGMEAAPRLTPAPYTLIEQLQQPAAEAGILELQKQTTYTPPPGLELAEVTAAMTVTCHVSPDAGWNVLGPFLGDTAESLQLGMYDFTAPHILKRLRSVLRDSEVEMQMTLDSGESLPTDREKERDPDTPKANDLTEAAVVRSLKRAAGGRFEVAFPATGGGQTFASAYHIKVAVRDRKSFWLSSGNWQSSNQPEIDFSASDADRALLRRYNREWHVVVDHPGLARTFQQYLAYDYKIASEPREAAAAPVEMPAVLSPAEELLLDERAPAPLQVFAPRKFVFTGAHPLRVQPLLTPDNYAEHVIKLLKRARRKLYFQNQSLNPNRTPSAEFAEMMDLLAEYSNRRDMDVRMVFRSIGDTRKKLESLQAAGFNMQRVRIQSGCHTKGIIVDTEVVLLGSHNWTDEGVMQNRDASLILYSPEIAAYYEDVFLHDWERMSRSGIREEFAPLVAGGAEAAPEGDWVRVPWQDYEDES